MSTQVFPRDATAQSRLPVLPFLPGIAAWLLALAASRGGIDLAVADALYAWRGHAWLLRDAFATEALLHRGGRDASALLWVIVLAVAAAAPALRIPAEARAALLRLAISAALSTLLVSLLKAGSPVDCPWDLQRYGGGHGYAPLLSTAPGAHGGCFPAGHASAGYAWVAAWFTASSLAPRWRWPVLAAALATGAAFGIAQQLRGAHFLSHDLATLGTCWLVAVAVHVRVARSPAPSRAMSRGAER